MQVTKRTEAGRIPRWSIFNLKSASPADPRCSTIAVGRRIRELLRLQRLYGKGRWRKMKGNALVRLHDGTVRRAELHWYEAHGIRRKMMKRKRYLD